MLSYIKKEINRLLNWRILLSIGTGCLCVAASLRVYSAEAAMSFYAILVYLCYLFMIGICIGLATDDFESGAFIQVFTGKLSTPRVIAAKIIAAGIYAVHLAYCGMRTHCDTTCRSTDICFRNDCDFLQRRRFAGSILCYFDG